MLDDYFFRLDDPREIDDFIPLKEMSEIAHELFDMAVRDYQPKLACSANREFAQFRFMFHVEQLRESADEVKAFWNQP